MTLPTVILPGYLAGAVDYQGLERSLQTLGIPTTTVPLRWQDWLPTIGGRSVAPILAQLDATVQGMRRQYGSTQVNLIGHSAGGWLARIYLGEKPYGIGAKTGQAPRWDARSQVATLVTLGTPHSSQERWTRANLDFVNLTYPGAFYPEVKYVCVAGKAIYGDRWRSWLAYSSYQLTCGNGNCWGDGITPIEAAHLTGAENLVVEGACHSPKAQGAWYGSPEVLQKWVSWLS